MSTLDLRARPDDSAAGAAMGDMMNTYRDQARSLVLTLLSALGLAAITGGLVHADVTVQQQSSMSVAGINMDISSTERTSSDKQRRDSETKCHGLLAMFCRDVQGGEIVRLDKQLQWQLEPNKKQYTERAFPTPEERALAQQKLQALMDQMKSCPMPQATPASQPAMDTTHCQPSPEVAVQQTGEHATIVGHDTQKSSVVLSQSCTDPQTGDVCEMDYGLDLWLTSDELPGAGERSTFSRNYLAAQGLDPNNPQLQGMMRQFMAPYADGLKQLQGKSSDLKGYPLRSTFYVAIGGPHCGRAHQGQMQAQQTQAQGGASRGTFLKGLASSAVSGGLGGLFHHNINAGTVGGQVAANAANQAADAASTEAANAAGNAAAAAATSSTSAAQSGGAPAGAPSDTVRIVSFTTETTSVSTNPIPSDQFEIPAGWQLQHPSAEKGKDQQFTCPRSGN